MEGGRRRRRDGCATAARRAEGCAAGTIHEGVPDREPEAHVLSSDACGAGEWAAGPGAQSNRGQTAEGWMGLQGRDEQGGGREPVSPCPCPPSPVPSFPTPPLRLAMLDASCVLEGDSELLQDRLSLSVAHGRCSKNALLSEPSGTVSGLRDPSSSAGTHCWDAPTGSCGQGPSVAPRWGERLPSPVLRRHQLAPLL